MDKISNAQIAELQKISAATLRALSEENSTLRQQNDELTVKVASYAKRERAEAIAVAMEEKGLRPDLSMAEKVAHVLEQSDVDVMQKAIELAAPQVKTASVHEDGIEVESSGDVDTDRATQTFAVSLASIGE